MPGWSVEEMKAAWSLPERRARFGWYYYQMMNLAVARHLEELSEHYIIWDSDLIAVNPQPFFNYRDKRAVYQVC